MAHEDDPLEHERANWKPSSGLAVAVTDPLQSPELPPHRERITDKDPAAMKRAVRTVYTLFYLSVAASIWAIAAYMLFPIEDGSLVSVRDNNLFIGLGIALARPPLSDAALAADRLVPVSDRAMDYHVSFHLIRPDGSLSGPATELARRLLREAGHDEATIAAFAAPTRTRA